MRSIALLSLLSFLVGPLVGQSEALTVRGLSFEGNSYYDDVTLASRVATTNSSWLVRTPVIRQLGFGEKRRFGEYQFRRDVLGLEVFYKYSGFPDVQIDTTVVRSEDGVRATFRITEGVPIRVGALAVMGLDHEPDRASLIRDLPLEVGDVFNRYTLNTTMDTLALRLRNDGYPTATVDTASSTDAATRIAAVQLIVTPGTPAVFGEVTVTGAAEIDTAFIASLVTARAGEPYRLDDLYRSQRALYQSELFRGATVGIDTTRFQEGDPVVPLLVSVVEGKTHRARAVAGYATNDCFRLGAGWTARNFLGNGRVVDVSGRISKLGVGSPFGLGLERSICSPLADDSIGSRLVNYGLDVTLRRPGFLSPDNTLALSLFSERRSEYRVYLREEVGAGIALTRETAARIPLTFGYRISFGQTEANDVVFCQFFNACAIGDVAELRQRRVLVTLSANATRERVNNVLNPTRGSILTADLTISSRYLGSSTLTEFVRFVAEGTKYIPLSRRVVLALHAKAGAVVAPDVDFESGRANFVPPEQRFYAGGANDVRGFGRNELGPQVYVVPRSALTPEGTIDPAKVSEVRPAATGGNRLGVANAELRFPTPFLGDRFRLGAFVDAGALWNGGTPALLRITPGVGLRVTSPVGPIRLDVAWNSYRLESGPVYSATDDGNLIQVQERFTGQRPRHWNLNFSIGHAF
ncbi:MAG: BamA/TamA family outer membrane protein [Gemmatimonadota bacterium]